MPTREELPAFFFKCACKTQDCPNQILWINKDKLVPYGEYEVGGCVPIASFTPEELSWLKDTIKV